MRSVVAATLGLSLAGCATVSVIPSETTVTAEASEEQSALRSASEIFCEKAEAEGWVSTSPGILGIAAILMKGARDAGEPAGTYADRIDAATADPGTVLAQIKADASTARGGLMTVTSEAEALLASEDIALGRLDVTAFERALVRAQLSNRGFGEALEIVAGRSGETAAARAAVEAFALTIDEARPVADALTARYSRGDAPASQGAARS